MLSVQRWEDERMIGMPKPAGGLLWGGGKRGGPDFYCHEGGNNGGSKCGGRGGCSF